MRDYQLAEHVHACVMRKGTIFLDLRRDAYSGITADESRALAAVVDGWPGSTADVKGAREEDSEIIKSLCESGVLVSRSNRGHSHCAPLHDEVTEELKAWRDMRPAKVRVRDVLAFFRALLTALVMIHCRGMSAAAARARRLSKTRAGTQASSLADPAANSIADSLAGSVAASVARPATDSTTDLARARELLTTYTYIRMFVFARRGRCLLDSLTLLEFLAARGVHVSWIIGVRARPFSAHCWLQHQHWVLNGTPAFVRGFHAILAT